MPKERSVFWYSLPLIFSIFGAIAAYFLLKNDDPPKAKNCIWIGIFLLFFYAAYFLVFTVFLETFEFS